MNGFDYDRIQQLVVAAGLILVVGLWAAEDAGLILVATPEPAPVPAIPAPMLPGAAAPPQLVLQGVIAASDAGPAAAVLAEAGRPPVRVVEGASFNEDIRVERVLHDRVVLRWRASQAPIVLALMPPAALQPTPMPVAALPLPAAPGGGVSAEGIPLPPPDVQPPRAAEALPARRLPAPVDASGLPPGPGLSGPALSGPAAD